MNSDLLSGSGNVAEILDILTRHLFGGENGVDHGDLELLDVLLAGLLQHGHTYRVVLIDEFALHLERIGENERLERVERAGEALVLRLECTLGGTNVLDAVDDLSPLRFQLLLEVERRRDLHIDNVDQCDDDYAEDDLSDSFHFINKYLLLILCTQMKHACPAHVLRPKFTVKFVSKQLPGKKKS